MEIPSSCPICKTPLTNEYKVINLSGVSRLKEYLQKSCTKSQSHILSFHSAPYNDDLLEEIILNIPEKTSTTTINWSFSHGVAMVISRNANKDIKSVNLPIWEPDLSNLPKLLSKIRKYLIFS
jgi:hypothetical protein